MNGSHHTAHNHLTVRKKRFGFKGREDLRAIQKHIKELSIKRGYENEDLIAIILEDFKQQGLIRHFYSTRHWSKKDRSGIDFVIYLLNGEKIALDSKSSFFGMRKFRMLQIRKGRNIWNIRSFPVLVKTDYRVNDLPLREEIKRIIEESDAGCS